MRLGALPIAICILGAAVLPALAQARSDEVTAFGFLDPKEKDKSKPIRRELEQAYAGLETAIEKNDAEAILAFRHPDFGAIDFQGRTFSAEDMRNRTLLMVSQIQPPIDAHFLLGTIGLNGDDAAVVTVRQAFSRTQRMADVPRRVDTNVTQDETWVRTAEGWKLRFVQNVRNMQWYVDGKRVDPGKPYDPDAPPYVPEAE